MVRMRLLRVPTLLLAIAVLAGAAGNPAYFAYIGTYTGHGSQGIYVYRFEPATGGLTSLGLAAQTENPSFLAAGPRGMHLYAVNENEAGSVSAFRIDRKTGKLTPLNRVPTAGSSPCALAVNHSGRFVLAANYGSGSVSLFPIKANGSLAPASAFNHHNGSSINAQRQAGPHAHSASFSPDDRFALSADLGVDLIYVYGFDAKRGTLATVGYGHVTPGSGPRHLAFHPNGKFVYAISELAATVTAFTWNEGALKAIAAVSALPPGYRGPKSGAEIAGASERQVPLRLEPRPGERHRDLSCRPADGQAHAGRTRRERWPNAAQLQHRSFGPVPVRREPGLEQRGGVSYRSHQRPTYSDGEDAGCLGSGGGAVRGGGIKTIGHG